MVSIASTEILRQEYVPLSQDIYKVDIADREILVVTLDNQEGYNSVASKYHFLLDELWTKFEKDPRLRVAIFTAKGRFFCTGADLKEWGERIANDDKSSTIPASGFLGLSNRQSVKPIMAAVNGSCFGGGTEVVVNCDLAVAVASASLSLPETRRGVVALAGALPRIGHQLGIKRATELAIVSEPISARTAMRWGLLNRVVENPRDLMPVALELARQVSLGSPDAVAASLRGIHRGYTDTRETLTEATQIGLRTETEVQRMPNTAEGLRAFVEKRKPRWRLFRM